MADVAGQQDIRDIFISRLLKGFADEVLVFKQYVTVTKTSAREIRWQQKTAGFLAGVTTTGMTTNIGANMSHLSEPSIVRQSFTRNTSYVREFFHETPLISDQDIKDNMVSLLDVHVRDLVRKIAYDVNTHIWDILTGNRDGTTANVLSGNSTAAWDAGSGTKIITDIERGKEEIREQNYEPTHLFVSPHDYASLVIEVTETKGSLIPGFASQKVVSGRVEEALGLTVVVSNSVTADYAAVAAASQAVTYHQFTELASRTIEEPMVGIKIRAREEGVAVNTDPNAVYLIKNTQT